MLFYKFYIYWSPGLRTYSYVKDTKAKIEPGQVAKSGQNIGSYIDRKRLKKGFGLLDSLKNDVHKMKRSTCMVDGDHKVTRD
jgi:hypothetical protein